MAITVRSFTCRRHGFRIFRCCSAASGVVLHPKAEFVEAFLRRTFPVYLPVNLADCFLAILTHSDLPGVVFVGEGESRGDLILDSMQWFEEPDVARCFLSSLVDSRLRFFVQRIRGRTNILKLLERPLVRSAYLELFRRFPRAWGGGGCCLDRGVRLSELQYDGRIANE